MDDFYKGFVDKVADSRKATPEQIHDVAQGRVWTGRQALDRKLVDALGGLETAVSLAKERAKIPAGEEVDLVVYPERRGLFDALSEEFGSGAQASLWQLFAGPGERQAIATLTAPARLFRRGEPLALMPFAFVR
jgi:protease-4